MQGKKLIKCRLCESLCKVHRMRYLNRRKLSDIMQLICKISDEYSILYKYILIFYNYVYSIRLSGFFAQFGSLPLGHDQIVVNRLVPQQFFVGAHFNNSTAVQYDEPIGIAQS